MEARHIEMAVEILKIVTFGTSHHILPGLRFLHFHSSTLPWAHKYLLQEEYEYYYIYKIS